jgi:hypothetical protein
VPFIVALSGRRKHFEVVVGGWWILTQKASCFPQVTLSPHLPLIPLIAKLSNFSSEAGAFTGKVIRFRLTFSIKSYICISRPSVLGSVVGP